jgi:hypothetical protein
MPTLADTSCASLPKRMLTVLAPVRTRREVKARIEGETAWVTWPAGQTDVAELIYPLPGAQLFVQYAAGWRAYQRYLPARDVPDMKSAQPLTSFLFPAPLSLSAPERPRFQPVQLRVVPDGRMRTPTALLCSLPELNAWLDTVPQVRFAALQAAHHRGQVLVLGEALPPIVGVRRYWGERVLTPLGLRYEPALPEDLLRSVLDIAARQLLLLEVDRSELISLDVFQPLRRAAVRAALTGSR